MKTFEQALVETLVENITKYMNYTQGLWEIFLPVIETAGIDYEVESITAGGQHIWLRVKSGLDKTSLYDAAESLGFYPEWEDEILGISAFPVEYTEKGSLFVHKFHIRD